MATGWLFSRRSGVFAFFISPLVAAEGESVFYREFSPLERLVRVGRRMGALGAGESCGLRSLRVNTSK